MSKLPIEENLSRFAPPYSPEKFTHEEKKYLAPFFTNIDKPIFVLKNLPEEVAGALSSRYSRATKTMRRMFLDEYIGPIVNPQKQKDWPSLSKKQQKEGLKTKKTFLEYIDFLEAKGGLDTVVNVQRGRKFFDKWLADYGDDSIAEMGGIHLCIEGLSNIAVKEIEDKRVGISPIEKSTRYVQFWDRRPDGQYQYIVPGEIKRTKYENSYRKAMNALFDCYTEIAEPYLQYIMKRYPKGEDETDVSFVRSRSAKRFDDIRDLLPIATQTYVALYGNGRAFEDLINRLIAHELGEVRWWGKEMCQELKKIVPSFVTRPETDRGAEVQLYRKNLENLRDSLAKKTIRKTKAGRQMSRWVKLLNLTKNPEIEVLSAYLFPAGTGTSLSEIRRQLKALPKSKIKKLVKQILDERKFGRPTAERFRDRFKKVPRAFENAVFLFEVWGRSGDYRDLQRHRQLSQKRQRFSNIWGYGLEKDVAESEFIDQIKNAYQMADKIISDLEKLSPDVAQYAVPLGYYQHWYIYLSAREIYWIVELRTGPQGREHYRQICQDIARQAIKAAPTLFQSLLVDMNTYGLSRRESEKKIEKKKKILGV